MVDLNPRHVGTCVQCSYRIGPDWDSSDRNIKAFYDRLDDATPGHDISAFRHQCEAREKEGRAKFGYSYLARDNPQDATEEVADYANYMFFEVLKARRAKEDELIEIALHGAHHALKAHEAARHMKAKRYGAP